MESEQVIRIFIPPALSPIQTHSYKGHGNEVRKNSQKLRRGYRSMSANEVQGLVSKGKHKQDLNDC